MGKVVLKVANKIPTSDVALKQLNKTAEILTTDTKMGLKMQQGQRKDTVVKY